ncbi:MAG: hypothetical protein ABIA76_02095 [Candidatus Diapherotrites archaeon]
MNLKNLIIGLIFLIALISGCTTPQPDCDGYQLGDSWPADDGCNTCQCTEQGIACTAMGCLDSSCNTASECEGKGLPHDECEGNWTCVEGECEWECSITEEIENFSLEYTRIDGFGTGKEVTEINGLEFEKKYFEMDFASGTGEYKLTETIGGELTQQEFNELTQAIQSNEFFSMPEDLTTLCYDADTEILEIQLNELSHKSLGNCIEDEKFHNITQKIEDIYNRMMGY